MSDARPQPYKIRNIHVVAKGVDVLVREYTLDPGEAIPWHRHTQVSDYYFGLEGTLVVETRAPAARIDINVGQTATVAPPTVHHVLNPSARQCRFLLVQGIGTHDFIKAED
jgi:quercetin dioxygenase-like cupin family protein